MDSRKLRSVMAVVLLLTFVPFAWLVWNFRDMPQFGFFGDDGVYWVCAKSLAEGAGYRNISVPGQPNETRYPPLYPLLLSSVWRLDSRFPENLATAALVSSLMLPVYIGLCLVLFRRLGASWPLSLALCSLLALNQYTVLFGCTLMSELMFSCLLVAALIVLEQPPDCRKAAVAGLLAGCIYLTRSAGLTLAVSGTLYFLLRRQRKAALVFSGMVSPALIGWGLWQRGHSLSGSYFSSYVSAVSWSDLPALIAKNFWHLLSAAGGLLFLKPGNSPWVTAAWMGIALAAFASLLMPRRTGLAHYQVFACLYTGMLLLWQSPPSERLVFPIFPLLWLGLWTALARVGRFAIQYVQRPRRPLAAGGTALLATLALLASAAAFFTGLGVRVSWWGVFDHQRAELAEHRAAYRWVRANIPESARLIAYDAPLLYCHTGRRAFGLPLPLLPRQSEYRRSIYDSMASLPDLARRLNAGYLLLTSNLLERELGASDRRQIWRLIRENPALRPIYESPGATVFRRIQ